MKQNDRPDHVGEQRTAYDKNRRRILATQDVCGICGRPVDKTIPYPEPMSPCVDHIIPIKLGGHPSDINNLQLAHFMCNRAKSDRLMRDGKLIDASGKDSGKQSSAISNRNLPLSVDWKNF